MRQLGKIALLSGLAVMAGCATHAVRCDERLQAINKPRPKPAAGAENVPGAEAAPPAAPAASSP
jgi:hypothetical protein